MSNIFQGDFCTLLSELTLEEKVTLLSGRDFSTAAGCERLGIPPLGVADSISGIRPSGIEKNLSTASFPNSVCYASTWDEELLRRLGEELANQARQKKASIVLGPNINMHRDPRGGRSFECFSEDPLLSGQLAAAIVNGVRSQGVGSCPKHFVCNDGETLRHYYDVRESINGRPLREIYLAAWQYLLRACDPDAIMTAYNKVDGTFCSAHGDLINGVLRGEWGFKGIAMSDWFAVHDTVGPVKAGLDLEMPFPVFRGGRLVEAVKSGAVTMEELDARVLKMLELRNRTKACFADGEETSEVRKASNSLAREIATGGMVLLKNDKGLPLDMSHKIALIGEFAKDPVITGGGSASCTPQYRHSPLEIFEEQFPGAVKYAGGVRTRRIIPVAQNIVAKNGQQGVDVAFYNNDLAEPLLEEYQDKAVVWMLGNFKPELKVPGSRLEMTTKLTPNTTGEHILAVRCTGAVSLKVDGKEVLARPAVEITTEQFIFNHILIETRVQIAMETGRSYDVHLVMQGPEKLVIGEPTPYAASLCFEECYSEEAAIAEAVDLARNSDVSVVYAGRSDQYESEGFDLEDIRLPENQARLIKSVAEASKTTVLVLHCGNPIDVSAVVNDVDAILLAHFPGQEGAAASVDILTGKTCPSGRLGTTWFKTLEDCPSFSSYPPRKLEDGTVPISYTEGLEVGYRCKNQESSVRWPFGYGLSYTTFTYSGLAVTTAEKLSVSVKVENTGSVAGKEVVQVFVRPAANTRVWRPQKELKGFTKVSLEPGASTTVTINVDLKMACSYWDEEAKSWRVDSGTYGVDVGGLQADFNVAASRVWNHL